MGDSILFQAFIFLLAGVVSVPIAKRLGLGSVLGYLIAGAVIGPYALEWVGQDVKDVMHFAEFGVVMMLFIVGLELEPSLLWRMRVPILGLGGAQVIITTALLSALGLILGFPWQTSLAIGMTLALSSTAIVLQTLNEKGLMRSEAGQSTFSVLLFQDIAVIPMLALMPLLAIASASGVDTAADGQGSLSGWQQALLLSAVVVGIVLAGRFLVRPLFRIIADTGLREVFTATALLLVIGIALLMGALGLSAALGTFLAGVVLAESEYRHELEAEIEPFKGLLLALFFISVGASINFELIAEQPGQIVGLALALIAIKMVVLAALGRLFGLRGDQNSTFSFALAQGGEFAFVLFAFATSNGVLSYDVVAPLIAAVAITMALTPVLMIFDERVIQPRLHKDITDEQEADLIESHNNPIILAGYGRFGQVAARLLRSQGYGITVLEHDASQVELSRRFGHKVFFGDASRLDLLRAAGAAHARLLILATNDVSKTLHIVALSKKYFPHLKLYARARGRREAYALKRAGVDFVIRETFHSALQMGRQALEGLGIHPQQASRSVALFEHHDEIHLNEMAHVADDETHYITLSKENAKRLEEVLRADAAKFGTEV